MQRKSPRTALALLGFALLSTAMSAEREPAGRHPEEIEAQLAGHSLDRLLLPPTPGVVPPAWVLLTTGNERAPRLDLFAPRTSESPIPLFGELPDEVEALALFDLDGDGAVELLVGGSGWLASLGSVTEITSLGAQTEGASTHRPARLSGRVEAPGLDPHAMRRAQLLTAGEQELALTTAGRLRLRRGGRTLAERPLPTRARRSSTGLTLTSPPVQRLPNGTLIAGPEALGDLRLRSLLFTAPADASVEAVEAWSRFSGPETVATARYTLLDGAPVLVATTYRADKLGIFERQKLRIFTLGTDRTRAGEAPRFETLTESRRWQRADPHLIELTGDDRQDLLLVHAKGLGGKELLVDLWEGRGGARFGPKSRRSVLDFEAVDWHYGSDLTGDGIADLVAAGDDAIALFAGSPAGAKRPLERAPRWIYNLPAMPESEPQTEVTVSVGSDGSSSETAHLHAPDHFETVAEGILIERPFADGPKAMVKLIYLPSATPHR